MGGGGVQSHFRVKPNYVALFWVVGWVVVLTIGIMVAPLKKVPMHLHSSQNRILIKNGTVVNSQEEEQVDIYIEVRLSISVIIIQTLFILLLIIFLNIQYSWS